MGKPAGAFAIVIQVPLPRKKQNVVTVITHTSITCSPPIDHLAEMLTLYIHYLVFAHSWFDNKWRQIRQK